MEKDNLNDEDKAHASPLLQRSEEQGCNLLNNYPANNDGVARDYPQNDNEPQISQSHNRGRVPSVGNIVIDDSSQVNNHSNAMRHYPREGDHQSLLHGPNSGHAPFNLNSSEKPAIGNIVGPPLDFNSGMSMFSPNQGVVSLNSHGILDRRYLTSNSGSNTNVEVNSNVFGINVAGESQRGSIPPLNTHPSIMDSRRLIHPNFVINNAISGSQNSNKLMHGLPQNAGAWMHSTDNHNLRPSLRLAQPSLPSSINQIMQHQFAVFSSTGMVSNQPLYGQLPEHLMNSYVNSSLQSSASPLGTASRGMSPSNLGRQAAMGNMNAQASMLYARNAQTAMLNARSSLKRGVSEPQSFVAQARQRRTPTNRPLIPPSVPTWTASASSIPHTTQTSFASSQNAIPFNPQATSSTVFPPNHTWSNTDLSAPSLPPQAGAVIRAPHHGKTMPSSLTGSQAQTMSPPHQPQTTPSLPKPRPKPRRTKASSLKGDPSSCDQPKDETQKPLLGYKCFLCNRDLSFTPEGPIRQPSPPPVSSVLPCRHTFHYDCLLMMTPEELSPEPPCIPCALGE